MIHEFQGSHLFCRLLDSLSKLGILRSFSSVVMGGYGWITESVVHVDGGCGAFEDTECSDHGRRHSILWLIDFEVLERSFGLGAPVPI